MSHTSSTAPPVEQPAAGYERSPWIDDGAENTGARPETACIHQLFEERARAAPDHLAVVCTGEDVTYAQLNRHANRLATHLRSLGVGPEMRVGICVERSIELIIGMLAILKAGAAFVPLDPKYPLLRLAYLLEDSRLSVLLTESHLLGLLPEHSSPVVLLDRNHGVASRHPHRNVVSGVSPDNLAYVIYTSGSTGRPKGIALQHRGVVNNLIDLTCSFGIGPGDRVLAISSPSFDMCVVEVLGTLSAGATMFLPDSIDEKDPAAWADLIARHRITVWNSAPQLLEQLVTCAEGQSGTALDSLRLAMLGGDWIPVGLPDRFRALAPAAEVIALGGATEVSIHSTMFRITDVDPAWKSIPYGTSMTNQRAYVLDDDFAPCPANVAGELHLGGVGLARGYLAQPAATAERFVPDPLSGEPGSRLFKTGDLARLLPDGNIELLGRLDFQVKIRGQRVDLGEIASVLTEHQDVDDAVVLAGEDEHGDTSVVAYVVPSAGASTTFGGAPLGTCHDQVLRWRSVYDDTYSRSASNADPTMNTIGWISSYDDASFAEEEIREIVDDAVRTILELHPRRVLEIGCGTGMILFRVAPCCSRYDATDISSVVVESLRQQVDSSEGLRHVTVSCDSAADLADADDIYDTVVLNSVVQHFPSTDYLARVLTIAASKVADGGSIFIGDIRALPLLEAFRVATELHRAPDVLSIGELQERVRRRIAREKELFVDPQLFSAIRHTCPRIGPPIVRLKRGRHDNEITRFHYDVVLPVGRHSPVEDVEVLRWDQTDLDALRHQLKSTTPAALRVRDIPNARLAREFATMDILSRSGSAAPVEDLRDPRRALLGDKQVHPHDICSMESALPYRVELRWPMSNDPSLYDAVFVHRAAGDNAGDHAADSAGDSAGHDAGVQHAAGNGSAAATPAPARVPLRPLSAYGNAPARGSAAADLAPRWRRFLEDRLPDYMVPAAFVVLDRLPLSPNGKVDYRALPAPERTRLALDVAYAAARNPIEGALAEIWSLVLGFQDIGVFDSFFDLGGHSLTATQIIARVNEVFGLRLPLRTLFEDVCIARLAESVTTAAEAEARDLGEIARRFLELHRMSDEEISALRAGRGDIE